MQLKGLSTRQTPKNLEQLRRLLMRAGQLEHLLLCSYLFTGYSLKQDPSEGGIQPGEQLMATAAWKGMVIGVAVQEMLHLALASNLLAAVGGKPNFSRQALDPDHAGGPNATLEFPLSPAEMTATFGYPSNRGVWLGLWPFADADRKATAIEGFVWFESYSEDPDQRFPGPAWANSQHSESNALMNSGYLLGLEDMEISTLVEIYKAIAAGFVHLNETLGHDALFCGNLQLQVTEQEMTGLFNFPPATVDRGDEPLPAPLLVRVHDVQTALMAINTIIVQGEGDTQAWEEFVQQLAPDIAATFPTINTPPHHEVFEQVLFGVPAKKIPGYNELAKKDPDFNPVRDLPENPLSQDTCHSDPVCESHIHVVEGFNGQLAGFFDALYNVLIDTLALAYTHESDSGDLGVQGYEKATLVQSSVRSMVYLMSPLGNALAQMGSGPGFIYRESHASWDAVTSALYQLSRQAQELATLAPNMEIWLTPAYLAIPPAGHSYPQITLKELLSKILGPDLLFMSDRLKRVRGHKPPVAADGKLYDVHVCQGLNACKGQDITGSAAKAGEGLCATADPHVCSGQNHCKGQGGCGYSPGATHDLAAAEKRQNHPGQNQYAGLVPPDPKAFPDQIYFVPNNKADSACGSPILPSLLNTYGENTDPDADRGGNSEVYDEAKGYVWEFARKLFEDKYDDLDPGEFKGEDNQGIQRYR